MCLGSGKFVNLKFIQHIIDGNLNAAIFFIDNLGSQLDLINEKVELLFLFS